jgi:hypothetical protein
MIPSILKVHWLLYQYIYTDVKWRRCIMYRLFFRLSFFSGFARRESEITRRWSLVMPTGRGSGDGNHSDTRATFSSLAKLLHYTFVYIMHCFVITETLRTCGLFERYRYSRLGHSYNYRTSNVKIFRSETRKTWTNCHESFRSLAYARKME